MRSLLVDFCRSSRALARIAFVCLVSSTAWPLADGSAKAAEVDDIIAKANLANYYAGKDGRAIVRMAIVDPAGKKQERELVLLRYNQEPGGKQMYYVYFQQPADVRKMVFMVHKDPKGSDSRWLYLPALDLVKRIAAGDKRTSFAGSDFVYEDVSGRNPAEDRFALVSKTDKAIVIDGTPLKPADVEFAKYTVEIDPANHLIRSITYSDAQGKPFRKIETLEAKFFQGIPTVTKSVCRNLRTGARTEIVFDGISYNLGLQSDLFTERYLRRAPKEALQVK